MKPNELIKKAEEARKLSYSPYSHFAVGAALLCKDGRVFIGTNVENSSYPLCMCAERNALYNAMYFRFARALKPENDICFSNNVMIDEEGRLYLDMMYSPDIYATFRLTFKPGSFGYSFFDGRSGTTRRFWRDGDKFYIAKTAVFTIRS